MTVYLLVGNRRI